jgi:hypothetical protein
LACVCVCVQRAGLVIKRAGGFLGGGIGELGIGDWAVRVGGCGGGGGETEREGLDWLSVVSTVCILGVNIHVCTCVRVYLHTDVIFLHSQLPHRLGH